MTAKNQVIAILFTVFLIMLCISRNTEHDSAKNLITTAINHTNP